MALDDLPGDHRLARRLLETMREAGADDIASQFEARYIECLDQGASKDEAERIAVGETLAEHGEEAAEQIGEGFAAIDGLQHEMEQWRALAGVSPPDES